MRVAVAHNFYSSAYPSGENGVVEREVEALELLGVDVRPYFRSSDEISLSSPRSLIAAAMGPTFHPSLSRDFREFLSTHQPEIVHFHNLYPLISPQAIRIAHQQGIPTVMTHHNYRRWCVKGTQFRDGRICNSCPDRRSDSPALRHGCYRNSRVQTAAMLAGRRYHRETSAMISRHVVLTPFMRQRLMAEGVGEEVITVRSTAAKRVSEPTRPGRDFIFLGRLSEEKGIALLLQAWEALADVKVDQRLHIAGAGALQHLVERASDSDPSIVFHGQVSHSSAAGLLNGARTLVVPSLWYEGFPAAVSESMSLGRPVVAVDNPNMRSVVGECGWFSAPTPAALAMAMRASLDDTAHEARRAQCLSRYTAELCPERSDHTLLRLYEDLVGA